MLVRWWVGTLVVWMDGCVPGWVGGWEGRFEVGGVSEWRWWVGRIG